MHVAGSEPSPGNVNEDGADMSLVGEDSDQVITSRMRVSEGMYRDNRDI